MAGQVRRDRFVAVLTELGGSAGNGSLHESLRWAEATHTAVKDELITEGIVITGRGRGGSVSLATAPKEEAKQETPPASVRISATPVKPPRTNGNGGNLGFEAELFKAADQLRGNMEPSDRGITCRLIHKRHWHTHIIIMVLALLGRVRSLCKLTLVYGRKPSITQRLGEVVQIL